MRAVVIATGTDGDKEGLGSCRPYPMLPLVDRPFIQWIVEFFIQQGVTEYDIILSRLPEVVERHLGDGTRWGCRFRYHLVGTSRFPYGAIRRLGLDPHSNERLLFGHCHTLPLARVDSVEGLREATDAVLFFASGQVPHEESDQWTGWGLMHSRHLLAIPPDLTEEDLVTHFRLSMATGLILADVKTALVANTPAELLLAQNLVLQKRVNGLQLAGEECDPGVWISPRATLSSTVTLVPPVFIGPDTVVSAGSQIGPFAAIGARCVLDRNCRISNSTVFADSYIGERIVLTGAVVDRDLAVNVRNSSCKVFADPLTLGPAPAASLTGLGSAGLRRLLALALLIAALPVLLVTAFWLRITRAGRVFHFRNPVRLPLPHPAGLWRTYPLWSFVPSSAEYNPAEARPGIGRFLLNVLPGLINVIRGELAFVGLEPRTPEQISCLPEEWRHVCLRTKTGLLSVTGLLGPDRKIEDCFAADAAYAVNQSPFHDFKIVMVYLWRAMRAPIERLLRPVRPDCSKKGIPVGIAKRSVETVSYRSDEHATQTRTGPGPHIGSCTSGLVRRQWWDDSSPEEQNGQNSSTDL